MAQSLNDREIRPEQFNLIGSKLLEKDLKSLRKQKLIKIRCPTCNSKQFSHCFTKNNFKFVKCKICKMFYVNPRPSYKSLESFYTESKYIQLWNAIFKETDKTRKEKIFKPRVKLVKNIFLKYKMKKCKTLLEVGCGYGWFCELAKKQKIAKEIIGIEPSPKFAEVCKKIKNITVIQSTFEKYIRNRHQSNVDAIVNFELIAHLFNPKSFLESCFSLLKPNGLIVLSTPNYLGFDIQILREKSDYISPHFLNYFDTSTIVTILKSVGFRKIEVLTPGKMDIHIILNKIKSGELKSQNFPLFDLIRKKPSRYINELQAFLQKHKLSSHMVVSAQK